MQKIKTLACNLFTNFAIVAMPFCVWQLVGWFLA